MHHSISIRDINQNTSASQTASRRREGKICREIIGFDVVESAQKIYHSLQAKNIGFPEPSDILISSMSSLTHLLTESNS